MIEKFERFKDIEKTALIPFEEIVAMDLNLSGVAINLPYKRIRFNMLINKKQSLLFSLEKNELSLYRIQQNKLFFRDEFLFNISEFVEDSCSVFYTRKNGKVLCFNPNNRSSCIGCRFCYQPKSNDQQNISDTFLKNAFEIWLQQNNIKDLSHLEQIAVVTGCFKNEQTIVDYLMKLREVLFSFDFKNEILFFGIISDIQNIKQLTQIKPLQICFTIECFENRDFLLRKKKNLELNIISELMKKSIEQEIDTTFSYIVGLDSIDSFKKNMLLLKSYINVFPIISLFQTDKERIKYRHKKALDIEYYLNCRKYIEEIFSNTNLLPNSWNNYRSLWRTCFNGKSIIDDK